MSTYNPSPSALERDADRLQRLLTMALTRMDAQDRRDEEETSAGLCYTLTTGEPRRGAR